MDMLQGTLLLEDLLNPLLITGLIIASSLFTAGKLFSKTTL
jgi:ABC-2 type transport system permease protein